MNYMFYISLFIFGTMFGSFASVLIYRLNSGESGILNGRSHCPKCNNKLGFFDLIPIYSWLANFGKCRYCKEKISKIYPFLELSTGLLFLLIGYFLIDINLIVSLNANEIIKLFFWLSIGFITIIYTFYDILFLEIHDGVMLSGVIITGIIIILQSLGFINILETINYNPNIENINISIIYFIIIIIALYIIMLKNYSDIIDVLILFFILALIYSFNFINYDLSLKDFTIFDSLLGVLIIFIFFYIQYLIGIILHKVEKKTKKEEDYRFSDGIIGAGDLRIAILIGLILGYKYSASALMFTYLVGTVISITILIVGKIKNKEVSSQVPFGPFLAIGFFITIFYSEQINILLKIYF